MWGALRQNLSYSIRTLVKKPGFTVTAVLTLALGNRRDHAIFSVVYAVFEPLPYRSRPTGMVWSGCEARGTPSLWAIFLSGSDGARPFRAWKHGEAPRSTWLPVSDQSRSRVHHGPPGFSRWRDCPC